MQKIFMSGYYQGVVEVAPASLSAAKVEELAITMTIQHLRHAGVINNNAAELEEVQASLLSSAFTKKGSID